MPGRIGGKIEDQPQLSAVLLQFARTLVTDFSIQDILDRLVGHVVELIPVTGAGVLLLDTDADEHFVSASDKRILRIESLQLELQEGPCILGYKTGEAVMVPDLASEERFPHFSAGARKAGIGAIFSFPLRLEGERFGALDLYSTSPLQLSENDLDAAQVLADVAAVYLFNARARADARERNEQLHHESLHDPLTGLPNRSLLEDRFKHAAAKSQRSKLASAVLYVDLDHFKAVNDTFGHHTGDLLLVEVVKRLQALLRPGDTLARLAGDEFVILCEEVGHPREVDEIADRVVASVAAPFTIGANEIRIGASVGIASASGRQPSALESLRSSDAAMYLAKSEGGGRHRTADAKSRKVAKRRADIERDLEAAIHGDQLEVLYQPIVDAPTGRWEGVETLLRWNHPRAGAVRPELIVAAAERTGLSTTLGGWVLRRACRDMQRWRDSSPHPPAAFAVNVSARDVMDSDLCSLVMQCLEQSGLAPETLCIELTENALLEDLPSSLAALERLRQLGVRLALDDFGTGYSSLRYLKHFPVDMLKIDQSFITDVGDDIVDAAIVGAIVELAHTLELTVVAEGVEGPRQLERVRALNCDLVQGYFFSTPLSAEVIGARDFGARPGRFSRGRRGAAGSALLPVPQASPARAADPTTP